jgi:hypothetical protein
VDIVLRCIATSAVSPNSDHALGLRIAIGRDPHDEELIRRKGAGTIYLYGARANADKKVSRCAIFFERGRAHFYSVKAAGVQQHRREQNSARFRSFASSSHVSIF